MHKHFVYNYSYGCLFNTRGQVGEPVRTTSAVLIE
jgi:hypothetical protein